jgi:NADH dehydrogenase FAD-containing subunit
MDTPRKTAPSVTYDVAVLGAGYAGLMAALRLRRSRQRLNIVLVNAGEAFLERVRLQETIVAAVPTRLPSISALVAGTTIDFIPGRVMSLDAQARRVRIANSCEDREIGFHEAVYALGSTIDTGDVPGVAALAYRLEAGDGPRSAAALRARLHENANRPLRIVTVGGAETSVEVAGEIKTAWPRASVTMISRSRCGDFKGTRVERAVRTALEDLNVALIDGETVSTVRAADIVTVAGRTIACDICVWSGGLASTPLARAAGLATDAKGRIG